MKRERKTDKKHPNLSDKQKRLFKHILSAMVIIVLVLAWGFIVKYGVEVGKLYIDDAISNVEMRNIENHQQLTEQNIALNMEIEILNKELITLRSQVKNLNEGIDVFSLNVSALKSSIDVIDSSVNASIVIQAEIGNKIQELDNRLEDLKKSLNILLEAP